MRHSSSQLSAPKGWRAGKASPFLQLPLPHASPRRHRDLGSSPPLGLSFHVWLWLDLILNCLACFETSLGTFS